MYENETPSYFSILTADIRYNKDLSASEKIFYSEITALTNINGFCTASNSYFAKLFNVDSRTIFRWLSHLSKLGFIKIDSNENIRKIYIRLKNIKKTNKKENKKVSPSPIWLQDYVENFENNVNDL